MRKSLSATITRPADTTAYAAGDVIGTASTHILTFNNALDVIANDMQRGLIYRAWLIDSAAAATLPSLELWLFNVAPAAQADNAVFNVSDAELMNGLVGIIPFTRSFVGKANDNSVQVSDQLSMAFEVAPGDTAIYGVLVVRNAYTPVSAEQFKIILNLD